MLCAVHYNSIHIHVHIHNTHTHPDLGPFCQYGFFRFVVKFLLCIQSPAVVKLPRASFGPEILFIMQAFDQSAIWKIRSNDSMIQLAWKIVSLRFYYKHKYLYVCVWFRIQIALLSQSSQYYLCKFEIGKKNIWDKQKNVVGKLASRWMAECVGSFDRTHCKQSKGNVDQICISIPLYPSAGVPIEYRI